MGFLDFDYSQMLYIQVPIIILISITSGTSFYIIKKEHERERWPHVMGRVAELVFTSKETEIIEIEYTYRVNDVKHFNNRFSSQEVKTDPLSAQELFFGRTSRKKHHSFQTMKDEILEKDGALIRVYYNPSNPWDSVLRLLKPKEDVMAPHGVLMVVMVFTFLIGLGSSLN